MYRKQGKYLSSHKQTSCLLKNKMADRMCHFILTDLCVNTWV